MIDLGKGLIPPAHRSGKQQYYQESFSGMQSISEAGYCFVNQTDAGATTMNGLSVYMGDFLLIRAVKDINAAGKACWSVK